VCVVFGIHRAAHDDEAREVAGRRQVGTGLSRHRAGEPRHAWSALGEGLADQPGPLPRRVLEHEDRMCHSRQAWVLHAPVHEEAVW